MEMFLRLLGSLLRLVYHCFGCSRRASRSISTDCHISAWYIPFHQTRISDLAPLTARVYTLTRRSATISPPERGGG